MLQAQEIEDLITITSSLDRPALRDQFLNFRGPFPLDFTPEFLEELPLERLRHIFVALCLQTRRSAR
jgi:hypothetical protein